MPMKDTRPILVLGGDGYLGWPLALSLARRNHPRRIVLVDNLLRRQLVAREDSDSLLPIGQPRERLRAAARIHGLDNMEFVEMDVNSPALESLVEELRPAAVYHLAQQGSAPYSMRGAEQALFTLRNNEEGNMRLLWAVKEHAPDCHIIKLGSFGEYATCGMDVAEGYFRPQYGGHQAVRDMPYPREADDFYHASKINDTNYISVACRNWGLRVTDVMQSTVFGTWTPEIDGHEALFTRLDYDACFGTVVNRFLAQAVRNLPLMVYGTGHQRTGLMSLNDTVGSLSLLWDTPPEAGSHRVINHLTEDAYSINELAETIRNQVAEQGFSVEIARGVYDPRGENEAAKLEYDIERRYIAENMQPESLKLMVSRTLRMLLPFRHRINVSLFIPKTQWKDSSASQPPGDSDVIEIAHARRTRQSRDDSPAPGHWAAFRQSHFPYRDVNLNPGTLGTPSRDVLDAMREFQSGEILAHPLAQYGAGRTAMKAAVELAARIWPSPHHTPHVGVGASSCANLLALALARVAGRLGRPLRLLTTSHEHIGGVGAFEKIPEIEVHYLPERALSDAVVFEQSVMRCRPDIGFFSHVSYDSGNLYPVRHWATVLKRHCPDALVVLDVSQSLGLLDMPFEHSDVLFGSCHKWLFGPRGTGLLWTNARFRRTVGGLNWSGKSMLEDETHAGFSLTGGMDFSSLEGLRAALALYRQLGGETVRSRSASLAAFLQPRLAGLLRQYGISHEFIALLGDSGERGVLTVAFADFDPYPLYDAMNRRGVHVKCIKDRDSAGHERRLLRFGCPYYESEERLRRVISVMDDCLQRVADDSREGARPVQAGTAVG